MRPAAHLRRSLGLTLAAALAAGACSSRDASPAPPPTTAAKPATTADLLASLAHFVGFVADRRYLDDWAQRIDSGQAKLDSYLDEIMATERFGSEIVPALVFGAYVNIRNYYALPSGFVLNEAADGALYLREPCKTEDEVTVHPWWDLRSEVKVCPDSYRPEKWTLSADEQSYRSPSALTCDSQIGSPELETKSLCGCGPNLIRCLRDEDQYDAFNRSLMAEVKQTTAYVVAHDMPMATLFTANQTFRDRNAELYYRRQRIDAQETADVSDAIGDLDRWPQDGQWAPRPELVPGQHAGLLTAAQLLHWNPDRRQRQRGYYEMMWCNLRNSFGATTKKVLEINSTGDNAFANSSWKRLAHTPLCTNCHARLDYGFQFFLGYPDSRASTYFVPSEVRTGTGELYGHDIDDPRGEAPLTPQGFAKLATTQPEFDDCMATHFVTYVLGDRATPDDVKAIQTAVEKDGTFKAPMKVALERYAQLWRAKRPPAPPALPVQVAKVRPDAKGGLSIGPALRTNLDHLCGDCHDEAPYSNEPDHDDVPFDFSGPALPRELLVDMVDRVAFGTMPQNNPLDEPSRQALVKQLIATVWSDADARAEAEHYYLGRGQGLPAQQLDNVIYMIDRLAGAAPGLEWGALERGLWSDQSTITPGFVALTGLEALRACQKAHARTRISLEDCLTWTTSIQTLSRQPPK